MTISTEIERERENDEEISLMPLEIYSVWSNPNSLMDETGRLPWRTSRSKKLWRSYSGLVALKIPSFNRD